MVKKCSLISARSEANAAICCPYVVIRAFPFSSELGCIRILNFLKYIYIYKLNVPSDATPVTVVAAILESLQFALI